MILSLTGKSPLQKLNWWHTKYLVKSQLP